MICCGTEPRDITTMDDRAPSFFCPECGKQGMASAFAEPPEPQRAVSMLDRARIAIAEWLYRLADAVAPQ